MRFKFLKQLILKLVISIALVYVLDNVLFSQISRFNILIAFLGSIFLLIGWINYLSKDGLNISKLFPNSSFIKSIFKKPKNKGVLNMYEDDVVDSNSEKNTGESIFSNITVGVILIIISSFI
ncbi:hypothetical protein E8P77_19225 [Soehngenia saccharolytica]|nr:hypothetical protein E8P77_19225 [Soehngenia saccharolytica]